MGSGVLVATAVIAAFAVAALILVLRSRRAAEDPSLNAVRYEMNLLRETTEKSIQGMSALFSSQLQSVTSNMQSALANVSLDVSGRLESIGKSVTEQMNQNVQLVSTTSNSVSERMTSVQSTFAALQKQVGEMSEQARSLSEMGKSVAALERVLTAPKLRGGFGESQLENLLNMVFSRDQFELQYAFGSGDVADAVLFFPQGKVAIDSKFPLENFRRMAHAENESEKKAGRREFMKDVKRRIDEVAAKYICPEDGTLPFALMYIPAENVYYESIIRDDDGTDLYAYCLQKRVIPVSPNSLYAYLQTILVGLNSMRVSQRAEVVLLQIESLKLELGKFGEAFETTGKHLRNATTKYNESSLMLEKVENRVEHLATGAHDHQRSLFESQEKPALKATAS